MNQKYEILKDQSIVVNGKTLYRIHALRDINTLVPVKAGDIGGYISNERNLSQDGNCWVYDNAKMFDESRLYHNARILDDVEMHNHSFMVNSSMAGGSAKLFNQAEMRGSSFIAGNTELHGNVILKGNACIRSGYLTEQHHYMTFTNVGSENGTLTVYKTKTSIGVRRGCFNGTVEEFLKAVEEKHGDNKFGKTYRHLIAGAKEYILG